jgi:hypothetical protein
MQSSEIHALVDMGVTAMLLMAAAAAVCQPSSTACRMDSTCRKSLKACMTQTKAV